MKNILFYKKEAKYFEEALPLGNGRIGGLVFGNLKKERIALNEDTLWSGYPKDLNKKDAYKYLDSARQAIFGGKIDKANEIVNKDMHGHWSESYLPFGDIIINYKGVSKRNYKRTLDISKGIAVAESDGFKETVFISHPAQLMVINIHSDSKISFKVKFKSQLKSKTKAVNDAYVINGKAPDTIWPLYHREGKSIVYGDKGMNFCGAIKVIGNAEITDRYIKVKKQNDITLLVSLATSFIDFKSMPNADSEKRAFAYLENTKSYKELLDEHTDDFSSLFDRVDFELDGGREDLPTDKRIKEMNKTGADYGLIALLFQFGRYLTISGSRPGTVAMNLQGIWNTHLHAPWSSNFTANINTEMNYWCTDIANLSECFEPLTAHVKKLAENGRITAHDYYNCRGFCAHHNNDIWGMTRPAGYPKGNGNSTQYAPWCMSGPWFLNQLYEHYLYTADENYKEEIRPLFEECLAFFKDFLVEHNGELVTCPSISPENSYKLDGKSYSLSYMTTMDRGILIEFFENCRELGFETPKIKPITVASDGRIPEWIEEYEETEIEHRHSSHLYCVYPSRLELSDELKKAAEKSLNVRGFGGTGWALGWKVCLWARLRNGENAHRLIKQQLTLIKPGKTAYKGGGTYPNLFDAHPPFQIDGNFGVTAGIGEMLKNGCIPKEWNGHIKGLKSYGGEEISYSFKNGERIN